MLVAVEMAKSAATNALFIAAANEPDFVEAAALAKAYCSETYFHAAADNIQIHGGMGFTWEAAPHLYFKRAKSSELLFGDAAHHHQQAARRGLVQQAIPDRRVEPLPGQLPNHGRFGVPQPRVLAHPRLGKHLHRRASLLRSILDPAHPPLPTQG
jgi:hypothetical protein